MTKNQIIFMEGKEQALKSLFTGDNCPFGFLAIGYAENNNGFQEETSEVSNGFNEISEANGYERIPLILHSDDPVHDEDTGKVLVKFQATLSTENITVSQEINQIAIVDRQDITDATKYYSALTFPTFTKTSESSITFVIGFRL